MMTLRRAKERHHVRYREEEAWLTFSPRNRADELAHGFGVLEVLNENRLPPGASVPRHPHHDAEIVTYVREGALTYETSLGCSGILHAGEFQRMTAGRGIRHSEMNASRIHPAHVFQIWLRPSQAGLEPSQEQKHFFTAERRGALCLIASPDGLRGSLRVHQDALAYSAMLDPGRHVVHELSPGRGAWLHVVEGAVMLGDAILTTGDSAGVMGVRSLSLTAREESELLLLDLGASRLPTPSN